MFDQKQRGCDSISKYIFSGFPSLSPFWLYSCQCGATCGCACHTRDAISRHRMVRCLLWMETLDGLHHITVTFFFITVTTNTWNTLTNRVTHIMSDTNFEWIHLVVSSASDEWLIWLGSSPIKTMQVHHQDGEDDEDGEEGCLGESRCRSWEVAWADAWPGKRCNFKLVARGACNVWKVWNMEYVQASQKKCASSKYAPNHHIMCRPYLEREKYQKIWTRVMVAMVA